MVFNNVPFIPLFNLGITIFCFSPLTVVPFLYFNENDISRKIWRVKGGDFSITESIMKGGRYRGEKCLQNVDLGA
jgi:hypothetical protein